MPNDSAKASRVSAEHEQRLGESRRDAIHQRHRKNEQRDDLQAVDRSRCALDPGLAGEAPDQGGDARGARRAARAAWRRARPARSPCAAPTNRWANSGAVSGVTAVQTISVASDSAASRPISAASAGADITGGRCGLQDQRDVEARQALGRSRARQDDSPISSGVATIIQAAAATTSARAREMRAHSAGSTRRKARQQQHEDRVGEERLEAAPQAAAARGR